jgi:hypothetical protein
VWPQELPATVSSYKIESIASKREEDFLFHHHYFTDNSCSLVMPLVESLFEAGSITKAKYDVHKIVVGREEFTAKDVTVQAHGFTKSAREAIEGAGGKCQLLKASTGAVIEA